MNSRRMYFLCGMLSPVVYVAMTLVGGAITSDYNHAYHAVSELMERGAPHKDLMDAFLITSNVLNILFGFAVLNFTIHNSYRTKVGLTGATGLLMLGLIGLLISIFFPMDPREGPLSFPGLMHLVLVGVLAILSILTPLLFGLWMRTQTGLHRLAIYSLFSAGLICVTGVIAAVAAITTSPYMGLAERLTIAANLQWTFLFALSLYRFNR